MPGGAPRRYRPRGHGAAGRGQGQQADAAADDGNYAEADAADGAWDPQGDSHQTDGGATSNYFGTNDAAGSPTAPATGHQAEGVEAMTGPADASSATAPPGYVDPNGSNQNMSPMQHVWFGPPASTWSSVPSGGCPGLYGTVPPQGALPHGGPRGPVPVLGEVPQQVFNGMGVDRCGVPFAPYGSVHGPGFPHSMMTPLQPDLPHQAPMSSAYTVPRPCADLPHGLPGGCGPQPHQVPSAVFQQAPNGMTGNGMPGFGQSPHAHGIGSGGNSPLAGMSPPVAGSPDRHGPRAQPGDPWSNYKPTETVTNAREFSQRLREERPGFKPVTSAFEAMGKTMPSSTTSHIANVTNEQLLAKLVDAVSGDRKLPIPTWDGTPSGLRGWLRQLSFWETESNLPKEKWGVRLFQSLSGEARKIDETVSTDVLLTLDGYSAVLTSLMQKFQPYLDAVGPLSIDTKYKNIFRKSRAKEVASLLNSGAIKILSVEESRKFAKEHPDHVLTSRYVDRWKPTDACGVLPEEYEQPDFLPENHSGLAPKSCWCVVGWKDPHIHQIERAAPTPLTSSMYLALQLAASRKWVALGKDAKTAFLQSRPTTRVQKLACKMPADEAFEGYSPEQLILLLTEVYGLVSGPAWWRRSLLELLVKELKYRVCVYDRCILTLDVPLDPKNPDAPVKTRGFIVLEVDDLLEAGDEEHRKKMECLEKRLKFGKIVNLQETENGGGSGYAGRRIKQLPDFSFTYSMDDYVANRLHAIKVHRKVLKKDAAYIKLNKDEISQFRGTIAAINWSAREGRPDGSASASILSGCFPEPTMKNLFECNQVVELLKSRKVTIRIFSIPEDQIRHLLIADSSFDPTGKTEPQHGWIQGITTPQLNRGEKAPVSLIAWT